MNLDNKYNIDLRQEMKPIPHAKYTKDCARYVNVCRMSVAVKIVHVPEISISEVSSTNSLPQLETFTFTNSLIDTDLSFFVIEE